MKYKKALKIGTRIENEHKATYNRIKRNKCKITPKQIYKSIAKDHIKELGTGYYPALIQMEKKLKKRKYYKNKY